MGLAAHHVRHVNARSGDLLARLIARHHPNVASDRLRKAIPMAPAESQHCTLLSDDIYDVSHPFAIDATMQGATTCTPVTACTS